jgi:hypothetical protein
MPHKFFCVGDRKVDNRPPGGYVASESLSLADNGSGLRIGKTKTPNVVGARLALVPNGARNVLEFLLTKKPYFGIYFLHLKIPITIAIKMILLPAMSLCQFVAVDQLPNPLITNETPSHAPVSPDSVSKNSPIKI